MDSFGGGGGGEGLDFGSIMAAGQNFLSKSGTVKPTSGSNGFAGMLDSFKKFTPEVQSRAADETSKLDDGHDIPLSTLDGNKRALLIGINYFGTSAELKGCINDVNNVKKLITSKFGFKSDPANMRILTDDSDDASKRPTKANIVNGMKWLVQGAKSGDSLFIHYSGHGATQKDVRPDTDEADEQDETLVPVDYQSQGMIVDDDIFDMLVAPLPKGVRLTAVMDCCHSGSVFDLPYSYVFEEGREGLVEVDNRKVAIAAALAAGKALMAKDYGGAMKNLMSAGKAYMAMRADSQGGASGGSSSTAPASGGGGGGFSLGSLAGGLGGSGGGSSAPAQTAPAAGGGGGGNIATDANVSADYIAIRTAVCDVIQFSGCRDNQTSADAFIAGESTGAMSYALIKALNEHGLNQTYSQLLKNIRTILHNKYSQVPQMSTGHKMMNLDGPFSM